MVLLDKYGDDVCKVNSYQILGNMLNYPTKEATFSTVDVIGATT